MRACVRTHLQHSAFVRACLAHPALSSVVHTASGRCSRRMRMPLDAATRAIAHAVGAGGVLTELRALSGRGSKGMRAVRGAGLVSRPRAR